MAGAMLVFGVVTPLKPPNEPRQFYPGGVFDVTPRSPCECNWRFSEAVQSEMLPRAHDGADLNHFERIEIS